MSYTNTTIKGENDMPLVKIGEKHQVTIPMNIFKKLKLAAGDLLEAVVEGNSIVFVPSRVIPKEDAWFYTKAWQSKEAEAEQNIKKGEVSGPLETATDLISHLRKS